MKLSNLPTRNISIKVKINPLSMYLKFSNDEHTLTIVLEFDCVGDCQTLIPYAEVLRQTITEVKELRRDTLNLRHYDPQIKFSFDRYINFYFKLSLPEDTTNEYLLIY